MTGGRPVAAVRADTEPSDYQRGYQDGWDALGSVSSARGVEVYRIGWWTLRWWPRPAMLRGLVTGRQPDGRKAGRSRYGKSILRDLRKIRRPHRPWQAEYDGCRWCRRGLTVAAARRKAAVDLEHVLRTGEWSPWVQRKVARRYGASS